MSDPPLRYARTAARRFAQVATSLGVPAAWTGYRGVRAAPPLDHHDRIEVIHPPTVGDHPRPANVPAHTPLPDDRGWWGYSFADVPQRHHAPTRLITLRDARVVAYREPRSANQYHPAVLRRSGRAVEARELHFREPHRRVLRDPPQRRRIERAVWFLERVYDNHSHWLTAHLPKLLLLQQLGLIEHAVMPAQRTPIIDATLHRLGINPADHRQFDTGVLEADHLTLLDTDRFRPELLRLVPAAFGIADQPVGDACIFISRSRATRRRLLNEDAVLGALRPLGFEPVHLEACSFDEQVARLRRARVVVGPHGAGLTNMIFAPPGVDVIEIADLSFPNPNFYALAAALGHRYRVVRAATAGEGPPLTRDMTADPAAVARQAEAALASAAEVPA